MKIDNIPTNKRIHIHMDVNLNTSIKDSTKLILIFVFCMNTDTLTLFVFCMNTDTLTNTNTHSNVRPMNTSVPTNTQNHVHE